MAFLYALSRYKEPLAARILADMLSIVDETGAWVEYYNNGVPMVVTTGLGKVQSI